MKAFILPLCTYGSWGLHQLILTSRKSRSGCHNGCQSRISEVFTASTLNHGRKYFPLSTHGTENPKQKEDKPHDKEVSNSKYWLQNKTSIDIFQEKLPHKHEPLLDCHPPSPDQSNMTFPRPLIKTIFAGILEPTVKTC